MNSALPLPLRDDGFEGVLAAGTRFNAAVSTNGSVNEVGNRLTLIASDSTGAACGLSKTIAIGADEVCGNTLEVTDGVVPEGGVMTAGKLAWNWVGKGSTVGSTV